MKRIALITDLRNTPVGEVLIRDLQEVLGGLAGIEHRVLERLSHQDPLEADIVLVPTQRMALAARPYLREPQRLLVVQRTIRESDASRVSALPAGTLVLVVNNLPETTLEVVDLFRQIEFDHLQFIPYEDGMDCARFQVAITPGERDRVPSGIRTVIDMGHRCIDMSTFIEVINRLKLADGEVNRRLARYSRNNVNLDLGVNHQYLELFRRNHELDTVVNLAHDGILFLDPAGRVLVHNRALREMLDLPADLGGCGLEVFPTEVREALEDTGQGERILETRGRSLMVHGKALQSLGEAQGTYFNFQEVTYIRKLEQNLNRKLREAGLTARYTFADVLSGSPRMRECLDMAKRIAQSDFTVLITGESGTGKELLAQSIHNSSPRARRPFVAVNCAAVPESLLESELFGYAGGSFTGALRDGKQGLFEQAHNGTIFLDEIGDMPPVLQAKLLRVLQERQVVRIGSNRVVEVDIRVIAATNHNLQERIRQGLFRADLYYRLNAVSLEVPPLRQRREDILPLLEHFLLQQGQERRQLPAEVRELLLGYPWPGNIRELENLANHLSLVAGPEVTIRDLPSSFAQDSGAFERETTFLYTRQGLERAARLLEVLKRLQEGGVRAGRGRLCQLLADSKVPESPGEMRGLLQNLQELGLVRSQGGRRGTEITLKGQAFLNWLRNRHSGQPAWTHGAAPGADRPPIAG
jgi:transcriptional regulator with PAS, ATPase and Fis domain